MGNDYDKKLDYLIAEAEAQGWTVTTTANGHWRFTPPDPGAAMVIAPGTSSADRAIANLRADLRRSGLTL